VNVPTSGRSPLTIHIDGCWKIFGGQAMCSPGAGRMADKNSSAANCSRLTVARFY
jgi:hypothetical protein